MENFVYKVNPTEIDMIVDGIDPENPSTYTMREGVCIHSLCILANRSDLLIRVLDLIGYHDDNSAYNPNLHPIVIAAELKYDPVLNILGRFFQENPCLNVTEEFLFKSFETQNKVFISGIFNCLF